MRQDLLPGDLLLYQLEAGYGLLRLLAVEEVGSEITWHLAAYADFFPDIERADAAGSTPEKLKTSIAHVALTNRAFESTQVSKLSNVPLTEAELAPFREWTTSTERNISDRSIRLLLGYR